MEHITLISKGLIKYQSPFADSFADNILIRSDIFLLVLIILIKFISKQILY